MPMDMTVIIISRIGSTSGSLEVDRAIVRCLSLPLSLVYGTSLRQGVDLERRCKIWLDCTV